MYYRKKNKESLNKTTNRLLSPTLLLLVLLAPHLIILWVLQKVRISRKITTLLLLIIEVDHTMNTVRDQTILRRSVISYMDIHRTIIYLRDLSLMDNKVIIIPETTTIWEL